MTIKGPQTRYDKLKGAEGIKIDKKIEKLINWSLKYPKAEVATTQIAHSALKSYAGEDKDKLAELLEEYAIMQEYYVYVRTRKAQRKIKT